MSADLTIWLLRATTKWYPTFLTLKVTYRHEVYAIVQNAHFYHSACEEAIQTWKEYTKRGNATEARYLLQTSNFITCMMVLCISI